MSSSDPTSISVTIDDNERPNSKRRSKKGSTNSLSPSPARDALVSVPSASLGLVKVGVAVEMKLVEVDDVKELFKVALLIHCHYRAPQVKPNDAQQDEFIRARDDEDPGYHPQIVLVNCQEHELVEDTIRINRQTGDVMKSFNYTADFREALELFRFPFDRQLFRVEFKSPNAELHRWSLPLDVLDLPGGELESPFLVSCDLNAWRLNKLDVVIHDDDPDPVSLTKGEFELTIRAERNPKFYLYNFAFVLFIIVLTNTVVVGISPEDLGDRMSVTLTLLLTAVAFKFVMMTSLPTISYQTWLDKYTIVSFLFLAAGIFENLLVAPRLYCIGLPRDGRDACIEDRTEKSTTSDAIFQGIFAASWILINIAIGILAFFPTLVQTSWKYVEENQFDPSTANAKFCLGDRLPRFDPATGEKYKKL